MTFQGHHVSPKIDFPTKIIDRLHLVGIIDFVSRERVTLREELWQVRR
jgi:hypothetical protein